MSVFNKDSSWYNFIDAGFKIAVTQTLNPVESDCEFATYSRTLNDIRCEDAFIALRENNVEIGWMLWLAMNMWELIDEQLKDLLILHISLDPPSSAVLYVKHPTLEDKYDLILWNSFSKTMPIVTEAILSGKTARAKCL